MNPDKNNITSMSFRGTEQDATLIRKIAGGNDLKIADFLRLCVDIALQGDWSIEKGSEIKRLGMAKGYLSKVKDKP